MNVLHLIATACIIATLAGAEAEGGPASTTGAIAIIDLASDSAWTLSVDDGPQRPIAVPGGGFNADLQAKPWIEGASVKDHVTYRRRITMPAYDARQTVQIEFGAVNHGAEVSLMDGTREHLLTTHVGPHMPFTADLGGVAQAGKTYELVVKAFVEAHYGGKVPQGFIYDEPYSGKGTGWNSRFARGIARYVRLAVYPAVRITELFVKTTVNPLPGFSYDMVVRNDGATAMTVAIDGRLSSWNRAGWTYPTVPATTLTVPAHGEASVTVGPLAWTAGPASWWWPNKLFREDYIAQLHTLDLTLGAAGTVIATRRQRFGFVEWGEGPFYYLVNGVRINQLSDSTPESGMSAYDCYTTSPAFLPPTRPGTGCPETFRRYMRLGMNTNRIHNSTPTEYMMDVADELGFMLIPETAIRGNGPQAWDDTTLPQAVRELAQACRNHPSTCRYSLQNECDPAWVPALVDAIRGTDATRPLVFEDDKVKAPRAIPGTKGGHAYCMAHYVGFPHPSRSIFGIGECAWGMNDDAHPRSDWMEDFVVQATDGRMNDMAYFSGWDWINYWPNFLEGMDDRRHAWTQKQVWHPDRVDGVDGWDSPVMRWVQRAFHPHLALDVDFFASNGRFTKAWPTKVPVYRSGSPIERRMTVFNDALMGEQLGLRWSARWDSPQGEEAAHGESPRLTIRPGFHEAVAIRFTAPTAATQRTLFLSVRTLKDDAVVFTDDQIRFIIDPQATITGEARPTPP